MQKTMFQMSREQGIKEGIEEGKLEGIEEGKLEGIAEGKSEGIKLMKTVRALLNDSCSVEEIMEKTGLNRKDIEAMK